MKSLDIVKNRIKSFTFFNKESLYILELNEKELNNLIKDLETLKKLKGKRNNYIKIIPSKCKDCKFVGNYTSGVYVRNPHYCCELAWNLFEEDYNVDPNTRDKNCPLEKIENREIRFKRAKE